MNPKKKKKTNNYFPPISSTNTPSDSQIASNTLPPQNDISNVQSPDDVALATQSTGDQSYNGWCQAFVEHATLGKTGVFPSAIDAWQNQQDKAVTGLDGIKAGDPIYFAPDQSNGGYGHTGIYAGDNRFISATDNGVKTYDLNDWSQITGQTVLGYLKEK